MKKTYILDSGHIRNCSENIAKMSIIEHIWYQWAEQGLMTGLWKLQLECLRAFLTGLWALLAFLINLLSMPFTPFIRAWIDIHNAQEDVEYEKRKRLGL